MPWWVWGLLGWSLLAVLLGVFLGRALRAAARRETATRRWEDVTVLGLLDLPLAPGQSVGPKTMTHPPEVSSSSRPPQVEP